MIAWILKKSAKLFCRHNWVKHREVNDFNFRGGYEHHSVVMRCTECNRFRTFEKPLT